MTPILAITSVRDDSTTLPLARALEARDAELIRLDTECFPGTVRFDLALDRHGWTGSIAVGDRVLAVEELGAIWCRRYRVGANLRGAGLTKSVWEACRREASATLLGFVDSFRGRVVDRPSVSLTSENKVRQLALAQQVGLPTPRTTLTQSASRVRAFAEAQGPLITKLLDAAEIRVEGGTSVMATSAVGTEDLEDLGGLELCPALFQPRIDKALEGRAVVVGDQVLAAAVDSQRGTPNVDWREESHHLMQHFQPIELPEAHRAALVAWARAQGMTYGAADFIVDIHGEWTFLEINAGGEWGWLQQHAGLDIAGALADLLLEA